MLVFFGFFCFAFCFIVFFFLFFLVGGEAAEIYKKLT